MRKEELGGDNFLGAIFSSKGSRPFAFVSFRCVSQWAILMYWERTVKCLKFTYAFVILTSLVFVSGCAANLPRISSGLIGCPEKEITVIADDSSSFSSSRTWTATCRGRRFFCSATKVSERSATLACTPETAPAN